MKFYLLGSLVLATTIAFAGSDVKINSFSVLRNGGGEMKVVVVRDPKNHQIKVATVSCHYKTLSAQDVAKTVFYGAGDGGYAGAAIAILNGEATLATDSTPHNPAMLTGTWSSMNIEYEYETPDGKKKTAEKTIEAPIVIIAGKTSSVLHDLEEMARKASASVCNPRPAAPPKPAPAKPAPITHPKGASRH